MLILPSNLSDFFPPLISIYLSTDGLEMTISMLASFAPSSADTRINETADPPNCPVHVQIGWNYPLFGEARGLFSSFF